MSYKIILTSNFTKQLKKILKKNPSFKKKIKKTLALLNDNPFHPSLRLHKLKGNLGDKWSISIDMSYRIILELIVKDKEIILLDIGSHDEVY